MICIIAIIRPVKLDEVKQALNEINVPGLTVTKVRGTGRQKGLFEDMIQIDQVMHLRDKVKIEVIVPHSRGEEVVRTIMHTARTGKIGDGKIFIVPVIDVFRIRTGESGEVALSL